MSFNTLLLAAFIIASAINLILMTLGIIDLYTSFKRNALIIMGAFLTIGGFYKQFFTDEPKAYWLWIMGIIILSFGLIWLRNYYRKNN